MTQTTNEKSTIKSIEKEQKIHFTHLKLKSVSRPK